MADPSFALMATMVFGTKRSPAGSSDKRSGTRTTHLVNKRCLPLMPVDGRTRERLGLNSPMELWQTYCEGSLDITRRDVVVVGTTEYTIEAMAKWPTDDDFYELVLQEVH